MIRRSRLFLLVFALTLTTMALGSKARAAECTDGEFGWIDFGSCCWQFSPPTVQLLRAQCVDGTWQVSGSGYKCPPDPC
jgi:hypothetical protein